MCSSRAISSRSAGPDGHKDDRDESAVPHWTEREIGVPSFCFLPIERCTGVRPSQAEKSWPFLKAEQPGLTQHALSR